MTTSLSTLEQLMFSLVEVWQSSGQTQRDFCREKELAHGKFQYWRKRYRDYKAAPVSEEPFLAVSLEKDRASRQLKGSMELVFPDGRRLVFGQGVEASFLRSLLG